MHRVARRRDAREDLARSGALFLVGDVAFRPRAGRRAVAFTARTGGVRILVEDNSTLDAQLAAALEGCEPCRLCRMRVSAWRDGAAEGASYHLDRLTVRSACEELYVRRSPPTVPEVLPIVWAFCEEPGNEVGGRLHVVLEDGNVEDCWLKECAADARAAGDWDAAALTLLLLACSKTQRRKVSEKRIPESDSDHPRPECNTCGAVH